MEKDFKILIALDSRNHNKRVVDYAIYLSKCLQAKLVILYVIDKDKELGNIEIGILPDDAHEQLQHEAITEVFKILKANEAIQFEQFIVDGNPADEIIKMAEKCNASMLIIETPIKTGLFSYFRKSVAEKVVKRATIPVVVVSEKTKW